MQTTSARPCNRLRRALEACQSGNASAASEAAAADRLPSAKSARNPGMNFAVAPPGPLASVES